MSNNRIVHFEIPANQPEALTKSCNASSAGGSRRRRFQMSNTGCAKRNPINGAVMKRQDAGQPGMNYVDESSIDATLEQDVKLGGKAALPKTQIADVGAIAAVIDPEGNICGL